MSHVCFSMMAIASMIPILGLLATQTTEGKLAVGNAQEVLAIVVIGLAGTLAVVFRTWRKDMEKASAERESILLESNDQLREVISKQNDLREQEIEANTNLGNAVRELSEKIGRP